MQTFVPKKIFFTKGVGSHRDELHSFERALRNAGIEKCNLVQVSSIFPPGCKMIPKSQGLKHLVPGAITYCVMSRCCAMNRKGFLPLPSVVQYPLINHPMATSVNIMLLA